MNRRPTKPITAEEIEAKPRQGQPLPSSYAYLRERLRELERQRKASRPTE
jgi:hypothetical protein